MDEARAESFCESEIQPRIDRFPFCREGMLERWPALNVSSRQIFFASYKRRWARAFSTVILGSYVNRLTIERHSTAAAICRTKSRA